MLADASVALPVDSGSTANGFAGDGKGVQARAVANN